MIIIATIRGITVKIGADTTGLDAALKDVNKTSREISKELREVERLLKFNPHDTELLAQKQKLLADQVENAREKLNRLKEVQAQVNQQFQEGKISEEQYRAFQRELIKTESQLKNYEKQLRAVNLQNHEFNQKMQEAGKKLRDVGKQLTDVGKTLSARLTAPLTALGGLATKTAIDFESAFAGVRKTVDATEEEFAALERGIRDMAKEIPASAVEIAGVAEAAGQLGIAKEHILSFTRTMIDLGEATNMSADEAATALARFANIVQMPQDQFDRLGSTVVALGNNLATTEAEIVNMGLRLAGAGKQVGMTEAEILSLAGALSSVGIAAEAGGSAFSKVMVNMQLAVETGGEALSNFASVAGMSTSQFRQAFQEDAAGALIAFIQGLQTAEARGMSAIKILDDMGITEVRLRDALLRAAGAGDLFAEAIQLGTQAWEENIALTNEAEQRYSTTAAKLAIMRNQLTEVAITFGEILLPPLVAVAEKVREFADWLAGLDPKLKTTILVVGGLAAALGPALLLIGQMATGAGAVVQAFGKLSAFISKTLIPAITSISLPVVAAVAGVAAFAAIAVEVYRNWNETKNALINIWELIKASAKQLGLNIAISFEEMKATVLNVIDAMLEKLGVLEKLPFGIGDKFKGLKDNISDSAEASAQKIAELKQAAEENGKRVSAAIEGTKVAFGDLGTKIAEDVKSVIGAITGQTSSMKDELEEQTEISEEALKKRAELQEEFNRLWLANLNKSTEDRLKALAEFEEKVLASAEELELTKTEIVEFFAKKRQEILDAETANVINNLKNKTARTVTDIIDEMQAKLQQLNDEYVVFGDEIDINSRKARIYKNAIIELIKEFGPNHEKVQELIEVYKELTKEEEKVIESTFDIAEALAEMEKSLDIVENKSVAFGDSFDKNSEKARILQNTISTLIENGIDPTDEKVQELVNRYNELTETSEEVKESTFSLEDAMKNYNVQLDILRNKNKVFGDSFDFAKEKANLLKSTINTLIENGLNPAAPQIAKLKAELDNLNISMKNIDTQTVTSTSAFGLFKDNVINYMKELKNNTEQASKSAARAIVSFADSIVSGQKTLKEALKEMLLNIITTLEQQVIAQQLAGVAIAWAQAPVTFGASLAWIPQIAAAVAPALATFEAIKAVIRGLATGGIVTGPTLALIGEGKDDEAVLPLNKNTLSVLGQAIAANMPQQQVVAQRPIEVKLQIGTLVADDLGLKKLERKLQSIRIQENLRLGVSQA